MKVEFKTLTNTATARRVEVTTGVGRTTSTIGVIHAGRDGVFFDMAAKRNLDMGTMRAVVDKMQTMTGDTPDEPSCSPDWTACINC